MGQLRDQVYQGTLSLQGAGLWEEKNRCSRHWSQIWAGRCMGLDWGLDPFVVKKKRGGRQGETKLSFVKVSKEGKKQAEVMAEPDPASSHFGCFLRCLLPFV